MSGSVEAKGETPNPIEAASQELFAKADSLLERYSVPYLNPLLAKYDVQMLWGQSTQPIIMTDERTQETWDVSVARKFVGEDSGSIHVLAKKPDMEDPGIWFTLKQSEVLNYKGRRIISQRVLRSVQDLIVRLEETIQAQWFKQSLASSH